MEDELDEERIIRLSGDIDKELVDSAIEKLHQFIKEPGEIIIDINSDGGSIEDGFRLIDAINIANRKECPVKMVVTGKAYSMAAFILCAGAKRTAYENARFMIHQPRFDSIGGEDQVYTKDDLKILYQEMVYYTGRVSDLLSSVGMKMDTSEMLMSKDSYFDADTALRYGLITEIEQDFV